MSSFLFCRNRDLYYNYDSCWVREVFIINNIPLNAGGNSKPLVLERKKLLFLSPKIRTSLPVTLVQVHPSLLRIRAEIIAANNKISVLRTM
jgi:hypothetical protein